MAGRAPTRSMEKELWAAGHEVIVGIDEVGRGAWAGPLMVGVAVLPREKRVNGVRDSKVLTEAGREFLFDRIASWCDAWAVGGASQEECDALGVSCQSGSSVVLRNHGLLSVGATVPAALRRLYMLERACEVEIIARGLDEAPAPIEDDVVQQYAARAKAYRASPEFGMSDWKAALRLIEGKGSDWRQ